MIRNAKGDAIRSVKILGACPNFGHQVANEAASHSFNRCEHLRGAPALTPVAELAGQAVDQNRYPKPNVPIVILGLIATLARLPGALTNQRRPTRRLLNLVAGSASTSWLGTQFVSIRPPCKTCMEDKAQLRWAGLRKGGDDWRRNALAIVDGFC
jgi:hypothetical protein